MKLLSWKSWRVLDNAILDFKIEIDGVSLKRNTYWIAYDKLEGAFGNEFLISFLFVTSYILRLLTLWLLSSFRLQIIKKSKTYI